VEVALRGRKGKKKNFGDTAEYERGESEMGGL
jgi:hypothetical protein